MTRYLLDTNIISDAIKPIPSASLIAWLEQQNDEDLYISSFTIAELRRGILMKPTGSKRTALEAWFAGPAGPLTLFRNRILPFDDRAALIWARLMVDGSTVGRPKDPLDTIIAAIAEANDCVVVTDNARDFAGMKVINPIRT